MSDDEILDLFLADPNRAMRELLDRHGAALLGNLYGYAHSRRYGNAHVEDVFADTVARLLDPRVRKELRAANARILPWLTRWGRWRLDDEARRSSLPLDAVARRVTDSRPISELLRDEEPPPSHLVHLMRSVLDQLPVGDRVLLILRYSEGISEKQIAAELRITESAAKKRLYTARRRLERLIEDADSLEGGEAEQLDTKGGNDDEDEEERSGEAA